MLRTFFSKKYLIFVNYYIEHIDILLDLNHGKALQLILHKNEKNCFSALNIQFLINTRMKEYKNKTHENLNLLEKEAKDINTC